MLVSIEKFCESLGCEGNQIFTFCSHKNCYLYGDKFFYLVNKTELQEWPFCKIKENRLTCGFCDNYRICSRLNYVRQCLINAWFFYHRKDGFKPIEWKVYFQWFYVIKHPLGKKLFYKNKNGFNSEI